MIRRLALLTSALAAIAAVSIATTAGAGPSGPELQNTNPGFERGLDGWEVYVAPSIRGDAVVAVEPRPDARYGEQRLRLRLPVEAQDNQTEYLTVGQTLQLDSGSQYRFRAQVRWNNPDNRLPSAIVSAWCRNADGSYSGVDDWLEDSRTGTDWGAPNGGYEPVEFTFTPNETGSVFCYVGLLTHQIGNLDDTEVLVDAFRVERIGDAPQGDDPRQGNLLADGGFDAGVDPTWSDANRPWKLTEWNPTGVGGLSTATPVVGGDPLLRLSLPASADPAALNDTWSGAFQPVDLVAGTEYELSATFDRSVPSSQVPTIVNVFAYVPESAQGPEAWIGPIDYRFTRSDEHRYVTTFTPTRSEAHQITLRVFGWGNDGTPVQVDIDDVELCVVDGGCPG